MTHACDHIDVDEFDREYTMAELFPVSLASELLTEIDGICTASVLLTDGTIYYRDAGGQKDYTSYLKEQEEGVSLGSEIFFDGSQRVIFFDLVHELETIGFLVLETADEHTVTDKHMFSIGRFAARLINRMINLNYRNRMTAGLHGQVVADSYESLKKKAIQLAHSEQKYRLLAENLEIEVEKKTRKIKETQLLMLQQEKMASIGQLAAGMAHEINNPVGFIISNLSTLKTSSNELAILIAHYRRLTDLLEVKSTDSGKVPRINQQIATIARLIKEMDLDFVIQDTDSLIDESLDGAKRVKIIVQNLRDFTHPSIDITESTDFNNCLETTVAVLSNYARPKVKITRQYGKIPTVTCYLREMNQVFFNILKNAFQAVDGQGEITISTIRDDDAVLVRISDTGPGIEKSHLGRIFDPFFTTREVGSGTGLGLFHAYSTVKALGGTISVESNNGEGSTFTVKIPVTGI